jgi:hypothetical protein
VWNVVQQRRLLPRVLSSHSVSMVCAASCDVLRGEVFELQFKSFIHIQDVHFAGLLDVENILSADTGISRKTGGNSFGDHLSSE